MKKSHRTNCSVHIAAYNFDIETAVLMVYLHVDEDETVFRNVEKWLLNDTAEYPRRL